MSDRPPPSPAPAALLEGLNAAQQRAVLSPAAPLCILAGAGSGKTRVLTRRIAHRVAQGSADPHHVLAITFTRKAAGELGRRLAQLGVRGRIPTGTFHAIAYAQLRQWWADTDQRAPELVQSKVRVLAPLLSRYRGGAVGAGGRGSAVQPVDVASEIEWAKARLLTPDLYAVEVAKLNRKPPLGPEAMTDLYRRYEAEKSRKGVVDFDDLLVKCVAAIESDKEFAARQRWRFRHLFVDEFQDVNPAQHRLLEGWLGASADLCVVGDPNQAIYAWNGADPRFLVEFPRRHPGGEVVRLDDNYRSSPEILTVADAVLGGGQRPNRALQPNRPSGALPSIHAYASDLDEARGIARSAREHRQRGFGWNEMAVLTRTNAQLLVFEEAFRAAGVPFRVRGEGTFLSQPEIRQALGELRRAPGVVSFVSRIADLEEMASEAARSGVAGTEGVNERAGRLDGLVRLAHEYVAADPDGTTSGFLAWLSATITSRADEPAGASTVVELTTFHRAKGLEWPVVFVAGLERGFVPIGQADDEDAWDEERRLLYVAVTRAERELLCSWAQSRTFGSRTTVRNPSPWLGNIEAAIRSCEAPQDGDWRSILRTQRERLAAAKSAGVPGIRGTRSAKVQVGTRADPKLLEDLKTWRMQMARASGVPAFVIVHDTTLAAIAEAKPSSRVGLLSLPGMGPVKVERYGEAMLEVVARAG